MRESSSSVSFLLALLLILTLSKVSALELVNNPEHAQGAVYEHHVSGGQMQDRQADAVTYPTPTGYGYPPPPPYGSEPTSSSLVVPYGISSSGSSLSETVGTEGSTSATGSQSSALSQSSGAQSAATQATGSGNGTLVSTSSSASAENSQLPVGQSSTHISQSAAPISASATSGGNVSVAATSLSSTASGNEPPPASSSSTTSATIPGSLTTGTPAASNGSSVALSTVSGAGQTSPGIPTNNTSGTGLAPSNTAVSSGSLSQLPSRVNSTGASSYVSSTAVPANASSVSPASGSNSYPLPPGAASASSGTGTVQGSQAPVNSQTTAGFGSSASLNSTTSPSLGASGAASGSSLNASVTLAANGSSTALSTNSGTSLSFRNGTGSSLVPAASNNGTASPSEITITPGGFPPLPPITTTFTPGEISQTSSAPYNHGNTTSGSQNGTVSGSIVTGSTFNGQGATANATQTGLGGRNSTIVPTITAQGTGKGFNGSSSAIVTTLYPSRGSNVTSGIPAPTGNFSIIPSGNLSTATPLGSQGASNFSSTSAVAPYSFNVTAISAAGPSAGSIVSSQGSSNTSTTALSRGTGPPSPTATSLQAGNSTANLSSTANLGNGTSPLTSATIFPLSISSNSTGPSTSISAGNGTRSNGVSSVLSMSITNLPSNATATVNINSTGSGILVTSAPFINSTQGASPSNSSGLTVAPTSGSRANPSYPLSNSTAITGPTVGRTAYSESRGSAPNATSAAGTAQGNATVHPASVSNTGATPPFPITNNGTHRPTGSGGLPITDSGGTTFLPTGSVAPVGSGGLNGTSIAASSTGQAETILPESGPPGPVSSSLGSFNGTAYPGTSMVGSNATITPVGFNSTFLAPTQTIANATASRNVTVISKSRSLTATLALPTNSSSGPVSGGSAVAPFPVTANGTSILPISGTAPTANGPPTLSVSGSRGGNLTSTASGTGNVLPIPGSITSLVNPQTISTNNSGSGRLSTSGSFTGNATLLSMSQGAGSGSLTTMLSTSQVPLFPTNQSTETTETAAAFSTTTCTDEGGWSGYPPPSFGTVPYTTAFNGTSSCTWETSGTVQTSSGEACITYVENNRTLTRCLTLPSSYPPYSTGYSSFSETDTCSLASETETGMGTSSTCTTSGSSEASSYPGFTGSGPYSAPTTFETSKSGRQSGSPPWPVYPKPTGNVSSAERLPNNPDYPWGGDSPIHRHANVTNLEAGVGSSDKKMKKKKRSAWWSKFEDALGRVSKILRRAGENRHDDD